MNEIELVEFVDETEKRARRCTTLTSFTYGCKPPKDATPLEIRLIVDELKQRGITRLPFRNIDIKLR